MIKEETTSEQAHKSHCFNFCFQQNFWKQLWHYWADNAPLTSRSWAILRLFKFPYFIANISYTQMLELGRTAVTQTSIWNLMCTLLAFLKQNRHSTDDQDRFPTLLHRGLLTTYAPIKKVRTMNVIPCSKGWYLSFCWNRLICRAYSFK